MMYCVLIANVIFLWFNLREWGFIASGTGLVYLLVQTDVFQAFVRYLMEY